VELPSSAVATPRSAGMRSAASAVADTKKAPCTHPHVNMPTAIAAGTDASQGRIASTTTSSSSAPMAVRRMPSRSIRRALKVTTASPAP